MKGKKISIKLGVNSCIKHYNNIYIMFIVGASDVNCSNMTVKIRMYNV